MSWRGKLLWQGLPLSRKGSSCECPKDIYEPDAVTRMEERYGHSTLKQLLIASELFDVLDEPLSNGGFRTIYRVK